MDEQTLDENLVDHVHALARLAADEAGVHVDDVELGLRFHRGEAHWTARVGARQVREYGACRALRSLAAV